MCIQPLSQESLNNMKNFKYKSTNDSILYNKCLSPCLNKLVAFLPVWLAPNLITFISLCFNILTSIISYMDGGFDFSLKLRRSTCFMIGFFQFIYQLLDNIDGKQARRTGNSTPFGMLMDHGCDVFTNIFTSYNLTKLLILGNNDYYSLFIFFGLILGFYMMTYEEYKLGELYFSAINGADEGNFMVFVLGIFLAIFGQDYMVYVIYEKYSLTVGKLIAAIVFIGGLLCIFNLYFHNYKKKGAKEMLKNFLDGIPFYAVFTVPILFIRFHLNFYIEHKWIILVNACLLFARVTIDIQIKILTMSTLSCNLMFIFTNFTFILSLFIQYDIVILNTLIFLLVAQMTELSIFIYKRVEEITGFLKIRLFCVKNQ